MQAPAVKVWTKPIGLAFAVASLLAAICGLYIVGSTIALVVHCWTGAPIDDQWDQLVTGRSDLLGWLTVQHNEHRIALPKLVFIADYFFSAEDGRLDLAVNILIQGAMGCVLFGLWKLSSSSSRLVDAIVAGMLACFCFWSIQYENFIWPFQVQFFGVTLCAASLFLVVDKSRAGMGGIILSILLMVAAAYTLASGIVAVFLAVLLAGVLGWRWSRIMWLAAAAAAISTVYFAGYQAASIQGAGSFLGRLPSLTDFFLVLVGSPIGEAVHTLWSLDTLAVSRVAGAVGILSFSVQALRILSADWARRSGALVTLGAFCLAMAVLTAVGRAPMGIGQALMSRYTSPNLIFWATLSLLTILNASAVLPHRMAWVALTLPVALMLLVVSTQSRFALDARIVTDRRALAIPPILVGVNDPLTIAAAYPDPMIPLTAAPALRAHRTSLYASPLGTWLGTPLVDHAAISGTDGCRGNISLATSVQSSQFSGWHAEGDVAVSNGSPNIRVVLTNDIGTVVGFGVTKQSISGSSGTIDVPLPWMGDFKGSSPESIKAFALIGLGKVCALYNSIVVLPNPEVDRKPMPPGHLSLGGAFDLIRLDHDGAIEGWATQNTVKEGVKLHFDTNLPIRIQNAAPRIRHDVASVMGSALLERSGFHLQVDMDPNQSMPSHPHLCVWTEDPTFGSHVLSGMSSDLCPEAKP